MSRKCSSCGMPSPDVPLSVDDGFANHGTFKPDATGGRCLNCGRIAGAHAGSRCFHVPSRLDCCYPSRFDLLVREQLSIEDA